MSFLSQFKHTCIKTHLHFKLNFNFKLNLQLKKALAIIIEDRMWFQNKSPEQEVTSIMTI